MTKILIFYLIKICLIHYLLFFFILSDIFVINYRFYHEIIFSYNSIKVIFLKKRVMITNNKITEKKIILHMINYMSFILKKGDLLFLLISCKIKIQKYKNIFIPQFKYILVKKTLKMIKKYTSKYPRKIKKCIKIILILKPDFIKTYINYWKIRFLLNKKFLLNLKLQFNNHIKIGYLIKNCKLLKDDFEEKNRSREIIFFLHLKFIKFKIVKKFNLCFLIFLCNIKIFFYNFKINFKHLDILKLVFFLKKLYNIKMQNQITIFSYQKLDLILIWILKQFYQNKNLIYNSKELFFCIFLDYNIFLKIFFTHKKMFYCLGVKMALVIYKSNLKRKKNLYYLKSVLSKVLSNQLFNVYVVKNLYINVLFMITNKNPNNYVLNKIKIINIVKIFIDLKNLILICIFYILILRFSCINVILIYIKFILKRYNRYYFFILLFLNYYYFLLLKFFLNTHRTILCLKINKSNLYIKKINLKKYIILFILIKLIQNHIKLNTNTIVCILHKKKEIYKNKKINIEIYAKILMFKEKNKIFFEKIKKPYIKIILIKRNLLFSSFVIKMIVFI